MRALTRVVEHPALLAILLGGFVAGTLDIGAAALINFANPILILRFIAGGLLGKPAMAGGASIVLLGLMLQWAMSLIAALYVVAARWLSILRRRCKNTLGQGRRYDLLFYY